MNQQQFAAARDPRPVTDSAEAGIIEAPGGAWMVWRSSWLLLTLPFGLTTSFGFMYIGLASGRRRWIVAAGRLSHRHLHYLGAGRQLDE